MKKIGSIILGSLILLSLVTAACSKGTETSTTTTASTSKTTVTTTAATTTGTQGKWWDKFGEPQYGGTFTLRITSTTTGGDPYFGYNSPGAIGRMYLQVLAYPDWTLDRDAYPDRAFGVVGIPGFVLFDTLTGELAESWERPDPTTIIFHIREGIYWQDKPPVNGRELTAKDIEYHWHRLLGLGSGFTKPSPYASISYYSPTKSVTATDKNTIVWELSYPNLSCFETLIDARTVGHVVPREVIEKYGDAKDWKNAVGTGPFILEDYVTDTSFTFIKNPNYWGYDERHPDNKLPYADRARLQLIVDDATAFAALRTGKLDIIEGIRNWRQKDSLLRTNPDLQVVNFPGGAPTVFTRLDKSPFTDIRVRIALQMSIDRESLAKDYYGGNVDATPCGLYSPVYPPEYSTPYDQWPENIKAEYAYNPEGAKELLAQAGYSQGFQTTCVTNPTQDLDLLQIVKSFFAKINVDMDIITLESTAFSAYVNAGKTEQMNFWQGFSGNAFPPLVALDNMLSTNVLNKAKSYINDPHVDELVAKAKLTVDPVERAKICKELSDYYLTQHWQVNLVKTVSFNLSQPWLKGYSGEYIGEYGSGFYFSRCWIDQELKKKMQ